MLPLVPLELPELLVDPEELEPLALELPVLLVVAVVVDEDPPPPPPLHAPSTNRRTLKAQNFLNIFAPYCRAEAGKPAGIFSVKKAWPQKAPG